MNNLRSAFLAAAYSADYLSQPKTKAEEDFALAAATFKNNGLTLAEYLRVGTALFKEMLGVGHKERVAKSDQTSLARTVPPMSEGGQRSIASDGRVDRASLRLPDADGGQCGRVQEDQMSGAPIGDPKPGEDHFSFVSDDQIQHVLARSPFPGEGQADPANDGHCVDAFTGNSIVDGDQRTDVSNDQGLSVPVDVPIAGAERPPLVSPSGQILDASPAREPHADVDDQGNFVRQDQCADVVHVRSHDRGLPQPKLPTSEQREANRAAQRMRAIGMAAPYHPNGMGSFKRTKASQLPARGKKALGEVKKAVSEAWVKGTEGVTCRKLYERREADNQTVPEIVPNAVEFNKLVTQSAAISARHLGAGLTRLAKEITGEK